LLAAYCKNGKVKTHLFFPYVFLFLFVDTYYILFYHLFSSLYFSIRSVFAALGNSLICLVINPAMYVLLGQERMCRFVPNLACLFLEIRERFLKGQNSEKVSWFRKPVRVVYVNWN
jgi:hypothetical protein